MEWEICQLECGFWIPLFRRQTQMKISFCGIHNSRNVLFLQIVLKRAAKPSAGNTSTGFPWIKRRQILLNLTWLCTKASQTFSGTFSRTFFRTFSGTLLNRTSAPKFPTPSPEPSPKPCWTRPGSAPKPPRPSPAPCWTWPGSAPKPSRPTPSPEPSPEPCWTWPGLALHQNLPDIRQPPDWNLRHRASHDSFAAWAMHVSMGLWISIETLSCKG